MKRLLSQLFALLFFVFLTARPAFAEKAKPAAHAAHKEPAEDKADKHDAAEGEAKAEKPEPEAPKGPTTLKVGVTLTKLNKFEMGPGTYTAEMYITMSCDHEPCKPELDVTNGKITGKEKVIDEKLLKEFKVKAEFEAFVDLSEFPFDRHLLFLGLLDKNPNAYHYEFESSTTGMDDSVKLAGWEIDPKFATNIEKLKLGDGHEINELQFGIAIKRPTTASFFKSLVPVFFMVFVAAFTLLLKPKSAAGRLSAATAGLMSVVMFHLSATSSLPPLGYLTRLDKFMLATYLIYMANIAFSVAMVRFEEKKNEKMSELAYLVAGGAVPGIALLAWLTVFLKIA
jgi:hypothetical protein